jgi:hypothetical protein
MFPFCSWDPKRCFYWGVPNVPKELMIGQSIWLLHRKKGKSCECTHELIDMNHTMSHRYVTIFNQPPIDYWPNQVLK